MPGELVGAAYAKIGLDTSSFESGLSKAGSAFSSVAGSIEADAAKLGSMVKTSLEAAVVAVAGLSIAGIKSVADFQEEQYNLQRTSGLTGEALQKVTDANRVMSSQFDQSRDSLDKVSTSLAQIAKTPEGINALTRNVAEFSLVSGTTNTEIAALDTTIGKLWGEGVPGIMKLNDGAIALKDSMGANEQTTLDFVAAFGPLGKLVGVTDTQAEALGATFQKAGIDGTDAIQSIYTGTNALIKNVDSLTDKQDEMTKGTKKVGPAFTDAALEAQRKLGDIGRTFGETGEQIKADLDRDYVGTLIKLGAHLRANAGDTQALQAATELFGTRGVKALMALGDSTDNYNNALKLLGDSTTIASDKNKDLGEKAQEIWTKLGNIVNATKDMILSFGEAIEPIVDPILDKVLKFAQDLQAAFKKGDWDAIGKMIGDGIDSGIKFVIDSAIKIGEWIQKKVEDWAGGANALGIKIGGWINTGVQFIVSTAFKIWDWITSAVESWGPSGGEKLGKQIGTWIGDGIASLLGAGSGEGHSWSEIGTAIIKGIGEGIQSRIPTIINAFRTAFIEFGGDVAFTFATVGNDIIKMFNGILTAIQTTINKMGEIMQMDVTTGKERQNIVNDLNGEKPSGNTPAVKPTIHKRFTSTGSVFYTNADGSDIITDVSDLSKYNVETVGGGYKTSTTSSFLDTLGAPGTGWSTGSIKKGTASGGNTVSVQDFLGIGSFINSLSGSAYQGVMDNSQPISYGDEVGAGTTSGTIARTGQNMAGDVFTKEDLEKSQKTGQPAVPSTTEKSNLPVSGGTSATGGPSGMAGLENLGKDISNLPNDVKDTLVGGYKNFADWAASYKIKPLEGYDPEKERSDTIKLLTDSWKPMEDGTKEAADTTTDASKKAAKIQEDGTKKDVKITQDANFYDATQEKSYSIQSGQIQQQYSNIAANALKLGAQVGAKFTTDGGNAVRIGLTASGQEIAVIGKVAQQNFTTGGNKWLSDSSDAGKQTITSATKGGTIIEDKAFLAGNTATVAASTAATHTTTAAQTFQQSVDSSAKSAMDAIAAMPDPGSKLVAGAQYAASALVSAGQSLLSMAGGSSRGGGGSSSGSGGNWNSIYGSPYDWLAEGTETNGPQMALIGEEGKEFVIPTKHKRWDLLLAAMKAYGIKGMAVGGEAGVVGIGGAGDETAKGVASVVVQWDINKLVKQTESQLVNLQNFFRTTWSLIASQSQAYWASIRAIVVPSVGSLVATVENSFSGLRTNVINTWVAISSGINNSVSSIWKTLEPTIITIHDNIINSFSEINSVGTSQIDQLMTNSATYMQTFVDTFAAKTGAINTDLATLTESITGVGNQLKALATLINQLNAMRISVSGSVSLGGGGGGGGGGGSGGDSGMSISSGSGGGLTQGAAINGGKGGFIDITCLGDPVVVNPLKYTNPSGQTSYINPMSFIGSGGVANYQGAGGSGGGGANLPAILRYADGGIASSPQMANLAENGPEMILPTGITRALLEGGSSSGGMSDDRIIRLLSEALSRATLTMDGEKVSRIVMTKATKTLRRQGGFQIL